MELLDEEIEKAMIKGLDVEEHLKSLTTVRPDVPLGPLTTKEARLIAHIAAKRRERAAYELVKKAEEHLRQCNEHWENATADMYATQPEN